MHVLLRTVNRQMTVFLFPIGLLFNSLLSFDEMNYKLLYVYCWRFVEKQDEAIDAVVIFLCYVT